LEINESKFIGTSKISIAITMNAEDWETIQKSKSWENIVNFVEEVENIRAMRKVDKEFYREEKTKRNTTEYSGRRQQEWRESTDYMLS